MGVGMLRTFGIFFLTLLGSLPLGMAVALLRNSKISVIRNIIKAYIAVMRGTPLMLQLLMWYFGPYYLFGIPIGNWRFPSIIVAYVMNYAAYFCEIYRSGGTWRFNAVGAGYQGGLYALCKAYGVNV